jgi:tRNA threonylcarbamoyladenosine biosynthesis protein TsaB
LRLQQNCSVALAKKENNFIKRLQKKAIPHAERLHVFYWRNHKSRYYAPDLSAVAVSQGPGSYTGLRIGVSAAKDCAMLNIPLIAIDTLQAQVTISNS